MERVLIVDDDQNARNAMGRLLETEGYTVSSAANGWEGYLDLDGNGADLIILDAVMPEMDGATFLRILRNDIKRMNTPVIVVSGHEKGKVLEMIGAHLVDYFLGKGEPDFPKRLLAMVKTILDKPSGEKSN
jgi:DNA-binding response OmpR family regulator